MNMTNKNIKLVQKLKCERKRWENPISDRFIDEDSLETEEYFA